MINTVNLQMIGMLHQHTKEFNSFPLGLHLYGIAPFGSDTRKATKGFAFESNRMNPYFPVFYTLRSCLHGVRLTLNTVGSAP